MTKIYSMFEAMQLADLQNRCFCPELESEFFLKKNEGSYLNYFNKTDASECNTHMPGIFLWMSCTTDRWVEYFPKNRLVIQVEESLDFLNSLDLGARTLLEKVIATLKDVEKNLEEQKND